MISKLAASVLAFCVLTGVARAADPVPIRITVIADLDNDVYDARAGRGGVDATRMAVADFGGAVLGRPIVVDALNDHNKPVEAPGLAIQAYDAGADPGGVQQIRVSLLVRFRGDRDGDRELPGGSAGR